LEANQMQKRWNLLKADEGKVQALHRELKINPVLCEILVERGIESFEEAKKYFRPQLIDLHDPWLMKDMDKAVERIVSAFGKREKILVFGDYDVDGTSAVACLFQFLRKTYRAECIDFYIPHRYREGYGVSRMGIDFAKENGFSLIVSMDCGIKSVDLIAYASTLGIDFIVCDHHLPDQTLPQAAAILNPKQQGCGYPYKELCGCGVGFKLIQALSDRLGLPQEDAYVYLDLVATAVAADIVPMTGENRILVYHGLKKANENPNFGIRALIELSDLKQKLLVSNLVFMIAPRVNAAGRMDDARKAVQMFVSDSLDEARSFAQMLHTDNAFRKQADSSITEEALEIIHQDNLHWTRKSTVVYKASWHKGVVGIVASRLIEKYYRPTVVLTQSGEVVAGSARSVIGFNLYEAIHACREHLLGYGGHFAAAGISLLPEQIEPFSKKFEEVVSATIDPRSLVPEIDVDAEIQFRDMNQTFFGILSQMEPFGPENARPVFLAKNVLDTGYSKIVKDLHIKFSLKQDGMLFNGIGFNMKDKFSLLQEAQPADLLFCLDENEWNGQRHLQLKVLDLRSAADPTAQAVVSTQGMVL
jgi:single-stranded-DNA-specific exonuclease